MSTNRALSTPGQFCAQCGAPAPSAATFCRECGLALEVPLTPGSAVFCRDCGGTIAAGDRYCLACGSPQAPNVPARTQPQAIQPFAGVRYELANRDEPDLFVRFLWFLFIGIWAGGVTIAVAWLAIITIIGAPLGLWMLNHIPTVMTLRGPKKMLEIGPGGHGEMLVRESQPEQLSIGIRTIYFLGVGWWFSLVWMLMAYLLSVLIIPLPLSMWMFDQVPALTTLEQR